MEVEMGAPSVVVRGTEEVKVVEVTEEVEAEVPEEVAAMAVMVPVVMTGED
jgi:hypothetical protein